MLKQHVPDFDSKKFKKMPKLEKAVFLLKKIKNMQENNEENKESHSFGDNDMVQKHPAAGGQDYTIPGLDIGGIIQQLLPIGVQILQGLLGQATGGGAPAPDPANGGGGGGAGGEGAGGKGGGA